MSDFVREFSHMRNNKERATELIRQNRKCWFKASASVTLTDEEREYVQWLLDEDKRLIERRAAELEHLFDKA